jgi:hypothetical protein
MQRRESIGEITATAATRSTVSLRLTALRLQGWLTATRLAGRTRPSAPRPSTGFARANTRPCGVRSRRSREGRWARAVREEILFNENNSPTGCVTITQHES